ncbi:MAG TPA: hypothetical protein PKA06_07200, partial [Gemmatales bacterium]|nr:hypothetical protein [Gemmatales bacterium]
MFRRMLLTALIALGLGTGLWADDLNDAKSLLQARFPGKIQKLNDIRENTHLEFFISRDKKDVVYVLGTARSPGETFDSSEIESAAENYIEGVSQTLPGMKILKKQKMQL